MARLEVRGNSWSCSQIYDWIDATNGITMTYDSKEKSSRSLSFYNVDMNLGRAQEIQNLLRHMAATNVYGSNSVSGSTTSYQCNNKCHIGELNLHDCQGNVNQVLETALTLDLFSDVVITKARQFRHQGDERTVAFDHKDNDKNKEEDSILSSVGTGMECTSNHLLRLRLGGIHFLSREPATCIRNGLSSTTFLQYLTMESCVFSDDAVSEISMGLDENASLRMLSMPNCHLGDTQVATIVHGLASHPTLQDLELPANQCSFHGLQAISNLLKTTKLESLDLESQQNNSLQCQMKLLVDGLSENQYLKRLILGCNGLLDEDMESLARVLWTCDSLEYLDLEMNWITDRGIAVFAIQTNPTKLRILRLYGNQLSKNAACHILQMVQINIQLGDVDCQSFGIIDSSLQSGEIEHFMDWNHGGRILVRDANITPIALWPLVLARANNLYRHQAARRANVIYHLLPGPVFQLRRPTRVVPPSTSSST